jgi:hypothetical protein
MLRLVLGDWLRSGSRFASDNAAQNLPGLGFSHPDARDPQEAAERAGAEVRRGVVITGGWEAECD